jgi:hypothetical protein
MDPRDRRKFLRLEGEFQVDLLNMGDDPGIAEWEAIVNGKALDVSRQGMQMQIQYDVAVGTVLSSIVYYRGQESVCLCEVVWKRPNAAGFLYGLFIQEWSKMNPMLEEKLSAMEGRTPQRFDTLPLAA